MTPPSCLRDPVSCGFVRSSKTKSRPFPQLENKEICPKLSTKILTKQPVKWRSGSPKHLFNRFNTFNDLRDLNWQKLRDDTRPQSDRSSRDMVWTSSRTSSEIGNICSCFDKSLEVLFCEKEQIGMELSVIAELSLMITIIMIMIIMKIMAVMMIIMTSMMIIITVTLLLLNSDNNNIDDDNDNNDNNNNNKW